MKYLLGIDFGGGASKATLIDTNGNIIAENTVEYPTLYPENGASYEELFKNADHALYQVKQNGKNDFIFYEE